jgi:hypothetical protein
LAVLDALRRLRNSALKELAVLNPEDPHLLKKEPETSAETPMRPAEPTARETWEATVIDDLDQHSSLYCVKCYAEGRGRPRGWTDPKEHSHGGES